MKPLIQFRLVDNKPEFYLLRDVPDIINQFHSEYAIDMKFCEQKALRIDNPEVLPIRLITKGCVNLSCDCRYARHCDGPHEDYVLVDCKMIKHNDTFSLPEDVGFEESGVDLDKTGKVVYRFIRLSKKEEKEPVKEESQEACTVRAYGNVFTAEPAIKISDNISWDTALTDGIEATGGSVKPYDKFKKYMEDNFTIQRKSK